MNDKALKFSKKEVQGIQERKNISIKNGLIKDSLINIQKKIKNST